jgi:hypothetical protein
MHGSVKFLAWLYEIVADFMLGVPSELFTTNWFTNASMVFSGIGVLFTILLGSYEGFRQVIFSTSRKQSSTFNDLFTLIRRLPFAVVGAGLAPKAFEWAFKGLDWVTSSIIQVGKDQVMAAVNNHPIITGFGWMDMVAIILFDLAFVRQMYPLFMDMAGRYFKLLSLGALSPLAISCWIFDEHRGWFDAWLDSIKRIMFMFLYWAIFLTVMGVLIVGIGGTTTFKGLFIRLLIIIGCVQTMLNPPSIMKRYINGETDFYDMVKETKDLVTLKTLRNKKEVKFMKGYLTVEGRMEKEAEKQRIEVAENKKQEAINQQKKIEKHKVKTKILDGYLLWDLIKNKFKK